MASICLRFPSLQGYFHVIESRYESEPMDCARFLSRSVIDDVAMKLGNVMNEAIDN
jgi:hypothetical protein